MRLGAKAISKIALACCLSLSGLLFAVPAPAPDHFCNHPFYFGLGTGFGSTTWYGLIPSRENLNDAILLSTPIRVEEGGAIYGLYSGFEFSPHFAIEAMYWRYPRAKVIFSQDSLFAFDHEDRTEFNTETQNIAIQVKVLLPVADTPFRFFTAAGVAKIYRDDEITKQSLVSPTFSIGFHCDFDPHWLGQFGFNYTAGYGTSEIHPANGYIPFLYSGFLGLAYRF